jgi:hypothetical protein
MFSRRLPTFAAMAAYVLTIAIITSGRSWRRPTWTTPILSWPASIRSIAEAVEADLLVSDDADAFETASDELGLEHQVCKSHVTRNTEVLIDTIGSVH